MAEWNSKFRKALLDIYFLDWNLCPVLVEHRLVVVERVDWKDFDVDFDAVAADEVQTQSNYLHYLKMMYHMFLSKIVAKSLNVNQKFTFWSFNFV